jgi:hypothetical protein
MENKYYVIAKFVEDELKTCSLSWDPPTSKPGSWKEETWIFLSTLKDILADRSVIPSYQGLPILFRAEFKGEKDQARNDFPEDYFLSVGYMLHHHIRDVEGFHNIVNNARLLYRVDTWNLKNLIKFNFKYLEESERAFDEKYKHNNIEFIKSLSELLIECNYRPELSYQELKHKFDDDFDAIKDWLCETEPIDKRKKFLVSSISNFEKSKNIENSYLNNPVKRLLNCTSIEEAILIAKTLRNSVSLLKFSDEIGIERISNNVVKENNDIFTQFRSAELHKQSSLLSRVLGENDSKA